MMEGLVFNIQGFSLHDGPGIRTTVFLKGCPLNCKWCSNPESIRPVPEIMSYSLRCVGCGRCVEICPEHAITIAHGKSVIDWEKCDRCLKCATVCLTGGITLVGKRMSVEEIVAEVEKDALFYVNSGGGVTFSGGEPLKQFEFTEQLCKECRSRGIHTALDTSGFCEWEKLERVLEHVDLVLYDVKHLDPVKHREWTGVDNKVIVENAVRVAGKVRTWLRVPLIPSFNDSQGDVKKIVELGKSIGAEKVSLLPYHRLSVTKYAGLGKGYLLGRLTEIPEDRIRNLKKSSESAGIEISLRE